MLRNMLLFNDSERSATTGVPRGEAADNAFRHSFRADQGWGNAQPLSEIGPY